MSGRRLARRSRDTLSARPASTSRKSCILPCRVPPLARRLTLLSPACRLLRHFQCEQVGLRTSFESRCGGCGSVFGTSWEISVSPIVSSRTALDLISLAPRNLDRSRRHRHSGLPYNLETFNRCACLRCEAPPLTPEPFNRLLP